MFGPARNGGESYLVVSGFAGGGSVIVYERTGGRMELQEVTRDKDVPMRSGCNGDRRGVGDWRDGHDVMIYTVPIISNMHCIYNYEFE